MDLNHRSKEYQEVHKKFLRDKYPKLSEQWKNHTTQDKYKDNVAGRKIIKEFGETGGFQVKKDIEEGLRKFKTPKQKAMQAYT